MYGNKKISRTGFYEFLGGKMLENENRSTGSIVDFMTGLHYVAHSLNFNLETRTATQPRDYVFSVLVDCPEYVVPAACRKLSLAVLMQDATDQLRTKHNTAILTTAPQGLFDATSPRPAFWHPEKDPACVKVNSLRDVYDPIFPDETFFYTADTVDARLPLEIFPDAASALTTVAIDYDMLLEGPVAAFGENEARSTVIQQLNQIVLDWTDSSIFAILRYLETTVFQLTCCRLFLEPLKTRSRA